MLPIYEITTNQREQEDFKAEKLVMTAASMACRAMSMQFVPQPGSLRHQQEQMQFYADFAARDPELKKSFEKKLVRKIDIRLLPLLVIMYLNNFLDRSALAQARIGTLEEDLGMNPSGTDFSLATSILFVGYILGQLPSNLLLTRLRPSWYLGIVMGIWGVVCALTSTVQNLGGLIAVRAFLGVTEAPFFPGAIFLMSCWYNRAELTGRIAWFYSGVSLANMFGGLIGAGVLGNMEGKLGIAGWRWLFIISGSITVFFALCCIFVLPDFPATTKWLTPEERAFAQWRLQLDAGEDDDNHAVSLWQGLKLCCKDYRLYLFLLLQHISTLSMTFQYFFPSIAPVWFAAFLISVVTTYTAGRTKDRSIHIICLLMISCVGNIIVTATLHTGARFFAMFLMPLGAVPAFQIIVAWVSNSFIRPTVKRSAAIAICNTFGNSATIYGAYMYPLSDRPRYLPGGAATAVICLLVAALAFVLRIVHIRENKKLEVAENEGISEAVPEEERRGRGFRYVY
ncbi:uncharacterized protein MYCFIDRAFT_205194 [Pseudocercospora fijiensis CIRAD86]|uniref:Major facilitator superfamily (MFS) profile domain-containing protein n=1 Tax=Pseudocercospora fijiensis (strain CIRAD86) TaxID=383855 RepID=M3AP28_PSEFD|nr:uncharacterized protein MYCFIDRAFT_205194 [Pseudocercospora fijiensis CIRAD86]EME78868.1 hypothetical protein MYCFIDRAFT_205194 [Pseudocercospora fijiensis CIRAD86]